MYSGYGSENNQRPFLFRTYFDSIHAFSDRENKFLKGYFLITTITVGSCVILQKAHYTIDVFAGLIFSYTSYQLVKSFHRKFKKRFKAL
ncbi:MAG: hypothetical protein IPL16_17625 [Ignavibacteria bacterium]|nr:hypothetical protein [Ignavibacteria bacterium]